MRRIGLLLLCWLLGPATAAAEGYRVDLIVVLSRDATPETAAAARSNLIHGPRAVDPADKATLNQAGISLLGAGQLGLEEEWRRLRNSRFRPVLRLAWLQAPRPTATALRLRDDFRYLLTAPGLLSGATVTTSAPPPQERYRLDGSFLLQQSAGLRVAFNLNYSWPSTASPGDYPRAAAPVPVSSADLMTVTLHGEKRINLNQNYFFDHPVLGVLLRVTQAP